VLTLKTVPMPPTAAATPASAAFWEENAPEFSDYSGNTMFNTLGNIAVNPAQGLLFLDFEGGGTLQLMGESRIVWEAGRPTRFAEAEPG
jgi:hypothetical protein